MNASHTIAAFLVALLLAAGSLAADKPAPARRVNPYPGSLKAPNIDALKFKLGISKSAPDKQPAPTVKQRVAGHETSSVPLARQPAPARQESPQDLPAEAQSQPIVKRAPARPAPSQPREAEVAEAALPHSGHVELPDQDVKAGGSVEAEFAMPIKPSQLSEQVRHGPVHRAGMSAEIFSSREKHDAVLQASASREAAPPRRLTDHGGPVPALKQAPLSPDDIASKQPAQPAFADARTVSQVSETESRTVAHTASPALLIQVLDDFGHSPAARAQSLPRSAGGNASDASKPVQGAGSQPANASSRRRAPR